MSALLLGDGSGTKSRLVWTSTRSPPAYSVRLPYMSSMRCPNMSFSELRLTFCVAVSSPSSWSSSLGIMRNLRICSTRAKRSLVCATMPWTSLSTSGFSVRSR
jgi:hypothetical protein